MDKYKALASNTLILAIGQFGSKLLVYAMLRFYNDNLGSAGQGDVTNITNSATLIMTIVTLAIVEAVQRFGLEKGTDGKQVFSIGTTIALLGVMLFTAFVPLIGMIEMLNGYQWLIYMYVFTGSLKGVCSIYVRSRGYVRLFAIDGLLTTVTMIILNLVLLGVFHLGPLGYVLAISLADAISIIFLSIVAELPKKFTIHQDKLLRMSMIRYSLPLIPTTVMWWVINVSDTFMVTYFYDNRHTGLYGFAYKFPNLIAIVAGIFSQAWQMSAITERNSRTIAKFYSNVFDAYQSVVYVVAAGLLLVLRPVIMPTFGGEEFSGAYIYVPFLVIAVIFQCFTSFLGSIYSASKKTARAMTTSTLGAVINITMNIILIPTIGVIGAAAATMASYFAVFLVRLRDAHNIIYMGLNIPKIVLNFTLLGAMSAVILLENTYYNIILACLFVVVILANFKTGMKALKALLAKIKK